MFAGDLADKNLQKALKSEDKRNKETKDEKSKLKKKPGYQRVAPRPATSFNAFSPMMGWQPQFQVPYGGFPPMHAAMPMAPAGAGNFYGPRPETRTCLNCRQAGHIARNCPSRPSFPAPSAAMGAPPK